MSGSEKGLIDCQSSKPEGERECETVRVYKAGERRKMKRRMSLFVGVGDTDLLTNAQGVAIQAGIIVQHAIEAAAVSFGNLPARIARLDVVVGATLGASFR